MNNEQNSYSKIKNNFDTSIQNEPKEVIDFISDYLKDEHTNLKDLSTKAKIGYSTLRKYRDEPASLMNATYLNINKLRYFAAEHLIEREYLYSPASHTRENISPYELLLKKWDGLLNTLNNNDNQLELKALNEVIKRHPLILSSILDEIDYQKFVKTEQ